MDSNRTDPAVQQILEKQTGNQIIEMSKTIVALRAQVDLLKEEIQRKNDIPIPDSVQQQIFEMEKENRANKQKIKKSDDRNKELSKKLRLIKDDVLDKEKIQKEKIVIELEIDNLKNENRRLTRANNKSDLQIKRRIEKEIKPYNEAVERNLKNYETELSKLKNELKHYKDQYEIINNINKQKKKSINVRKSLSQQENFSNTQKVSENRRIQIVKEKNWFKKLFNIN